MRDQVKKVNYCYLTLPSRAGQGAKILGILREANINLLAFSGFPVKSGKAQVDLVPEDMAKLLRVAKKNDWRLSKTKRGFVVQGSDRIGAVAGHLQKLADAKINVTALDALASGKGQYGMILWVKQKDYNHAAKVLGAK